MKNLLVLIFAIFSVGSNAYSQLEINLPTVIPPSPEVATLNNLYLFSTGLHTGSANISIPLYSFKVNDAKIEISLNYNSNGIKVDDIPGRVGLGWNLAAGGVISRIIRDKPDGDYPYLAPPENINERNQGLLNYLLTATLADSYDTEWDEFSYSFNGMSGKFFLDDKGEGYCIPHNNMKVKVYGHNSSTKNIRIITADGINYVFGTIIKEETKNIDIVGGENGHLNKSYVHEMAWFLEKIITPEGEVVDFSYNPVNIKTIQGAYQMMIKPLIGATTCNTDPCNFFEMSGFNAIEYKTYYLTNISTSGISINFSYEQRPDSSGDNRLIGLTVVATGSKPTIKKIYKLSFKEPTINNNSLNKRFFLNTLKEKSLNDGDPENTQMDENWLSHEFEYIDIEGMPARLSFSQDWYGFNNNINNNVSFAPFIPSIAMDVVNGSTGGNRNPGSLADMEKGLLKKIYFPTGGFQEFYYEPHTIFNSLKVPVVSSATTNGSGLGSSNPWIHTSKIFTAEFDQTASLYLSCHKSPAFPESPAGEGSKIFEIKLRKYPSGDVLFSRKHFYYVNENINIQLEKDVTYYIELTIWGEVNAGSVEINYNKKIVDSFENKIVGGVRIKEILDFDPITQFKTRKYFTYANYNDLSKSSGVGAIPIMYYPYITGVMCNPGTLQAHYEKCHSYMVSSNSLFPIYNFGGSHIAYRNVIESDDPDLINGFTEHYFITYLPAPIATNVLDNLSLGVPVNITTDLNGLEDKTIIYKNINGLNKPIMQIENDYGYGGLSHSKASYMVRKRWEDNQHYTPPSSSQFEGFDLFQYFYKSEWIVLNAVKTSYYDEDSEAMVTKEESFTYDNPAHLQATEINITSSETGVSQIVKNKYPSDFISISSPESNVYKEMIAKNIITPIIEQEIFKNQKLVFKTKRNYGFWFQDNSLIAPESIEQGINGGDMELKIRFNNYDHQGFILEQQKEGNYKYSYIWGYLRKKPIAEVFNAESNDVAYTSFEVDEGNGNWSVIGGSMNHTSAITGKISFNIANGEITKSIEPSKNYILSYWTTNPNGFEIIGTQGVPFSSRNAKGWKHFVHNISGQTQIHISGQGLIDELRLHPSGAQMRSYTYAPLGNFTSICDVNNKITAFEYDGYGRLVFVKDERDNILQKNEYNHLGLITNFGCLITLPNWQYTNTPPRCKLDGNNQNTGVIEREQKDDNPCSGTYNQLRWIDATINLTACPLPIAYNDLILKTQLL